MSKCPHFSQVSRRSAEASRRYSAAKCHKIKRQQNIRPPGTTVPGCLTITALRSKMEHLHLTRHGVDANEVRWKISAHHINLSFVLSVCHELSKLVEIWHSYGKNNFAQFFLRHGVETTGKKLLVCINVFYLVCLSEPRDLRVKHSAVILFAGRRPQRVRSTPLSRLYLITSSFGRLYTAHGPTSRYGFCADAPWQRCRRTTSSKRTIRIERNLYTSIHDTRTISTACYYAQNGAKKSKTCHFYTV